MPAVESMDYMKATGAAVYIFSRESILGSESVHSIVVHSCALEEDSMETTLVVLLGLLVGLE